MALAESFQRFAEERTYGKRMMNNMIFNHVVEEMLSNPSKVAIHGGSGTLEK